MCGIAGGTGRGAEARSMLMMGRMRHRGPDGEGVFGLPDGSAVAMCRLRIRSRPQDGVPFRLESDPDPARGRDAAAAYNGEVYGLYGGGLALPPPAGGAGEVVHIRKALLDPAFHADGMYALALAGEDGILLARDPFGIKPLFLRETEDGIAFASELGALLAPGPTRIRRQSVAELLAFGRPLGEATFFEGIASLPAGSTARLGPAGAEIVRRPGAHPAPSLPEERLPVSAGALREAVREAVRRTLVSDRPLGLAVSGGLDSSIIAAELNDLGLEGLATVSVRAEGSGDGLDSLDAIGLPGDAWRSWRHASRVFGPDELPDGIARAARVLGEPTAMTSVPLYLALADAAAGQGTVVLLTGEGADELFGGYASYQRWSAGAASSAPMLDRLEDFALPPARRDLLRALVGGGELDRCRDGFRTRYAPLAGTGNADDAEGLRRLEMELSLEPLLRRADHALMSRGIEGRVPFLHGEVPSCAFAMPFARGWDRTRTKIALRQAYEGLLPAGLIGEAKRPFRAPAAEWLRGPLAGWLERRFAEGAGRLEALGVRPAGLDLLLAAGRTGDGEASRLCFALSSLLAWLDWLDEGQAAGLG